MQTFIEYIGDILLEQIKLGNDPILVLPNKRPVAYLQKYMSSKAQQSIWFPKIYTIEDYVLHITKMQLADPIYTASCLYLTILMRQKPLKIGIQGSKRLQNCSSIISHFGNTYHYFMKS